MGRDQRVTVTDLRSDRLLEEVRQALKAEGCYAAIEIVKLLGAGRVSAIGRSPPSVQIRQRLM